MSLRLDPGAAERLVAIEVELDADELAIAEGPDRSALV